MRILLLIITALLLFAYTYSEPCQDYACDSMAVRAILDSNGLDSIGVDRVSWRDSTGRIDSIRLRGPGFNATLPETLKNLPAIIGNLTNLVSLNLHNNQISIIPDAIGNLSNLKELFLGNNQISIIPVSIGKLLNLTHLSFYDNQITTIPDTIGNLSNLKTLTLSYNQISIIPDAIGNLSNLTMLGLRNNQISEIPVVIGNLSKLINLYLSDNQISEIPEEMAQLSNLGSFYLGNNQISLIPDAIGNLKDIANLDLENNQICTVSTIIESWANTYDPDWKETQNCDTIIISIEKPVVKLREFSFCQNTPNPFNPTTTISFNIPKNANVTLTVLDIKGRKVADLIHNRSMQGQHTVIFNAGELPSGIYLFKLQAGEYSAVRRGILIK
jgi:Leucine-rich repeat (LRR) protein